MTRKDWNIDIGLGFHATFKTHNMFISTSVSTSNSLFAKNPSLVKIIHKEYDSIIVVDVIFSKRKDTLSYLFDVNGNSRGCIEPKYDDYIAFDAEKHRQIISKLSYVVTHIDEFMADYVYIYELTMGNFQFTMGSIQIKNNKIYSCGKIEWNGDIRYCVRTSYYNDTNSVSKCDTFDIYLSSENTDEISDIYSIKFDQVIDFESLSRQNIIDKVPESNLVWISLNKVVDIHKYYCFLKHIYTDYNTPYVSSYLPPIIL
jgi:hypothetical protein